jgi:membrane dipeptidase
MTFTPIFDGHNDVILRLVRAQNGGPDYNFFSENASGHIDLPRARRGGLAGGIFAIFTPTPQDSPERSQDWGRTFTENGYRQLLHSALDSDYARAFTQDAIDLLYQLVADSGGAIELVTSTREIENCIASGSRLALVLHFEGAEAIRPDLSDLEAYYQRGLRSLGIVWSRPNAFASGVPFVFPETPDTGPGLTLAGRALVRECNRLGILLDLAHMNEKGFWDVAELSDAPLVVTHTGVHAICPSTRNLTDRQIDAVGQSGGMVGVIFEPMNLREDGRPADEMPLAQWVKHVDAIAGRIGIDHVGLGSDFDGASVPAAVGSAAGLQSIIQALEQYGYAADAVEKIAYRNWLRVLKTTWKEKA